MIFVDLGEILQGEVWLPLKMLTFPFPKKEKMVFCFILCFVSQLYFVSSWGSFLNGILFHPVVHFSMTEDSFFN